MEENNTDVMTMESFETSEARANEADCSSPQYNLYTESSTRDWDDKNLNTAENISNGNAIKDNGQSMKDSIPGSTPQQQAATTAVNNSKPVFGNSLEAENRYKLWLRIEQFALFVAILIIWGLFALPIIFYHIPMSSSGISTMNETSQENVTMLCPTSVPYDGTVCREELTSLSRCVPPYNADGGSILIQTDQSSTAGRLLSILKAFGSDECKAVALPFLCVYFFGLCDSTGRAYTPSSSQCMEISTGVCATEWEMAQGLEFSGVSLPDCSSFPDDTVLILTGTCDIPADTTTTDKEMASAMNSTTIEGSGHGFLTTQDSLSLIDTQSTVSNCTCNEGFFCKQDNNNNSDQTDRDLNFCFPECGRWEEYSHTTIVIIDVVVLLAAVVGLVSGVGVLIITGIRRKKVLVFPSVLAVYQTISITVLAFFVLVNYMNRTGLYCSSQDLLETVTTATPFCIISGMVFHYTVMQLALWWLFHMAALYWKIRFPFHARRFESARRVRYIHFTAIVLALVIPAIPIIIAMIENAVQDSKDGGDSSPAGNLGFGMIRFPPILCVGIDRNVVYYSFIFPLNLIVIVGLGLLVLIFWIIHKQHGLFRMKQSKKLFKIETAEKKILIVFCYYVLLVIFSLITFTITTRNVDQFSAELQKYFTCELVGPSMPCSREGFEKLAQPEITSISYILLGLFPLVNLVFVVNTREVKEKFEQCLPTVRHRKPIDKKTASTTSNSDQPTSGTVVSDSVSKHD